MASILIVGGAGGLGCEIAKRFLADGDRILLTDGCGKPPMTMPGFAFRTVDLLNEEAAGQIVDHAEKMLGGIDAVVIAASILESAPIAATTAAMWDKASAIHLRLPFLVTQQALPALRRSSDPSVTILSSTAALRGQAFTHAYQATKAGVAGLVRSLAAELGPEGIRVNGVLAGWLVTPLTQAYWAGVPDGEAARGQIDGRIPLRRHGSAAEAASVVRFLASREATYLTGAMLPVDGGDTAV